MSCRHLCSLDRTPALMLIVAAVCYSGACANGGEQQPAAAAGTDSASPADARPAVDSFVQFAAAAGDSQPRLSDEQMADGLRKLAGALAAVNAGTPDLLIDLRIGAEQVMLNPASSETAAIIRDALTAGADAIERRAGPAPAVKEAAQSLRPDQPLIEQQAAVAHFFRRAAEAVQRAGS